MTSEKTNATPQPASSEPLPGQMLIAECRYRPSFESANVGVLILDAVTHKITDVNPFLIALLEYSRDEFVGRELWEIGSLKDIAPGAEAFQQLRETGSISCENLPIVTKGGNRLFIDFACSLCIENKRQVIQCNIYDITERKQSEQTALASEERFSSAFEYAGIGMALVDLDGGWLKVNRSLCDLLGYSAEELVSRTFQEITHPDDLNADLANVRALLANEIPSYSMEKRYFHKQGQVIWALLNVSLVRGRENQPLYFISQIQDITENKQSEAALRQSDERYRSLVLATTQIVWSTNAQGEIFEDLPTWRAYTGQSVEEISGMGWTQAIHPDDREPATKAWLESVKTRIPFLVDYRLRAADGTYRIFTDRGVPVLDSNAEIKEWIGTCTDITELKEAEAALQKANNELELRVMERTAELSSSEAQFRMLTEVMPQIVWTAQPDGFIDYYNAHWVEYTGMTIEQTQGWGWQPVLHPDDLDNCLDRWTESVRTGENYEVEYRFKRASDGAYRWHLGRALPLRDEAGNITKWFGTCTDIEDQKRAQEKLASSLSLLTATIESTADGLMALDLSGNIISRNTKFNAMWRYSNDLLERCNGDEMRGHAAEQIKDPDRFFQIFRKHLSAPETETFDTIELKDGRTFERYGFPQTVNEECVGMVVNFRDITDRKQATAEREILLQREHAARDEVERANATKGEILSRISHELRTPLNAILGFGQLLEMQEKELTSRQSEDVGHILKAGKHLLDLVNEVLEITRIDAPDSALSLEPVALSEVVQEALDMIQPLAEPGEISIIQQLASTPPIFVLVDRQRLLQILLNLLSNAIKYNKPDGQVNVFAEALPLNRMRLHVSDTGHGIAAADLPKLFVPFMRLNAENLGVEGTGLGLVLCRRLAQAMNGSLDVESQVGQGSTFSIELPLAPLPELLESGDSIAPFLNGHKPDATESASTEHTILLIEDNMSNFQLIERILTKRSNVRLIGAMQGGLGFQLAEQQRPDLILLDLHLPDIMGDEVLRRLQATPETQNIPVIMVSADASPSQIARLLAQGARQYLTKPLNVKQFLEAIDNVIRIG